MSRGPRCGSLGSLRTIGDRKSVPSVVCGHPLAGRSTGRRVSVRETRLSTRQEEGLHGNQVWTTARPRQARVLHATAHDGQPHRAGASCPSASTSPPGQMITSRPALSAALTPWREAGITPATRKYSPRPGVAISTTSPRSTAKFNPRSRRQWMDSPSNGASRSSPSREGERRKGADPLSSSAACEAGRGRGHARAPRRSSGAR
jgi:hypothetical protein